MQNIFDLIETFGYYGELGYILLLFLFFKLARRDRKAEAGRYALFIGFFTLFVRVEPLLDVSLYDLIAQNSLLFTITVFGFFYWLAWPGFLFFAFLRELSLRREARKISRT